MQNSKSAKGALDKSRRLRYSIIYLRRYRDFQISFQYSLTREKSRTFIKIGLMLWYVNQLRRRCAMHTYFKQCEYSPYLPMSVRNTSYFTYSANLFSRLNYEKYYTYGFSSFNIYFYFFISKVFTFLFSPWPQKTIVVRSTKQYELSQNGSFSVCELGSIRTYTIIPKQYKWYFKVHGLRVRVLGNSHSSLLLCILLPFQFFTLNFLHCVYILIMPICIF